VLHLRAFDRAHGNPDAYKEPAERDAAEMPPPAYDPSRDVSSDLVELVPVSELQQHVEDLGVKDVVVLDDPSVPLPLLAVLEKLLADGPAATLGAIGADSTLGRLLRDGWMWPLQAVKLDLKAADYNVLLEYAWRRRLALATTDLEPACDLILPIAYFDGAKTQRLTAMFVETKCRSKYLTSAELSDIRLRMYQRARLIVKDGPIVLMLMELGGHSRKSSRVSIDRLGARVIQGTGTATRPTHPHVAAAPDRAAPEGTVPAPDLALVADDAGDVLFISVRGLFSSTIGDCVDGETRKYMRFLLSGEGMHMYHVHGALGQHCGYDVENARRVVYQREGVAGSDVADAIRMPNGRDPVNSYATVATVPDFDPLAAAKAIRKTIKGQKGPNEPPAWLDHFGGAFDSDAEGDDDDAGGDEGAAGSAHVGGVAAQPPATDDGKRPI
jgi:hypothetical protein